MQASPNPGYAYRRGDGVTQASTPRDSGPVDRDVFFRELAADRWDMKRANGRPSAVRADQVVVMGKLKALGWTVIVGYGCDDALAALMALSYAV